MPMLAARVYHDQHRVLLVYWGSSGRIMLFVYRLWHKLPYSRSQLLQDASALSSLRPMTAQPEDYLDARHLTTCLHFLPRPHQTHPTGYEPASDDKRNTPEGALDA